MTDQIAQALLNRIQAAEQKATKAVPEQNGSAKKTCARSATSTRPLSSSFLS